jgi:hypothetical protein
MFGKPLAAFLFFGLAVAGLLAIGGFAGWNQGFLAGSSGSTGGVHTVGHGGGFFLALAGVDLLLKLLFFTFLFFFVAKLFFFRRRWSTEHGGWRGGSFEGRWREWHDSQHSGPQDQPQADRAGDDQETA